MKTITIQITLSLEQYEELTKEALKYDQEVGNYLDSEVCEVLERSVTPIDGWYSTKVIEN